MLRFSHAIGSEFIHAPSYDTFYGYICYGDFSYEAHPSHMALVAEWCVDQFGPPRIGIWNHHRSPFPILYRRLTLSEQRRFVYRIVDDYGIIFTMSDGDPIPYQIRDEVLDWCRERFGPLVNRGMWEANSWAGSAHGPYIDIGFMREDWAVEFRMRWC